MAKNVLGGTLEPCGADPVTGFYRDGCCNTGADDAGVHTVCAAVTAEFLEFSRSVGNDLSTPQPAVGFPGLRPGDRWCLCASRWKEAHDAGAAPPVVLEATHAATLEWVGLEELRHFVAGGPPAGGDEPAGEAGPRGEGERSAGDQPAGRERAEGEGPDEGTADG